ncbi:MAG: acyltransferase family protein [Peptococcaceae bacterium]|nr:acyltransferase family protein [Peptococcaceae bacterium]
MEHAKKQRLYGYDNIKFILIFLVVLGHLLEVSSPFPGKDVLYKLIYSCHMPVFIFISGFFAKFHSSKIVFHQIYPYVLFQGLYIAFHYIVLYPNADGSVPWQFTTPYWLLWYLMAMIFYYMLTPLLNQQKLWQCAIVVVLCGILSILAGYENEIGVFLTLSRFFVYLPYFVLGYYIGRHKAVLSTFWETVSVKNVLAGLVSIALMAIAVYVLLQDTAIKSHMMFGSYSYASGWYNASIRLQLLWIGMSWVMFFLFTLVPILRFKIPIVSTIGKNTLPVFLLHGFFMRYARAEGLFTQAAQGDLTQLVVCALVILMVLGNSLVAKVFPYVFSGRLLEMLWHFERKEKTTE